MKILKDEQFNELTQKSSSFDAILEALTKHNAELTPDDITSERIIDMIFSDDRGNDREEIEKLTSNLKTAEASILELEAENKNLKDSAAGDPAEPKTKTEPTGEKESLTDFCDKNAGDTNAILAKIKEEGLI
jgi:hypothetical protein